MKNIFIILICMLFACGNRIKKSEELWVMVKSENKSRIISATEEIWKSRDTSMIGALLYAADDPRITHLLSYKGKSVYQIKMEALRDITGIDPPAKITNDVDTGIIRFYLKRFPQHSFVSYKSK